MIKRASVITIFTVIVLFIAFGSTPDENVTDSKSAIKNAQQGLATDTVVKAGGEVIENIGNQAIDSACRDGASQRCSTTTTSVNLIGVAFGIIIVGIVITAIIGFAKFIMSVLESF
jgi:hypothetical protein